MTRDEHLRWAKDRALEYVEIGQLQNALMSFMSDCSKFVGEVEVPVSLNRHRKLDLGTTTEMRPVPVIGPDVAHALVPLAILHIQQNDREGMRRWIEGWA